MLTKEGKKTLDSTSKTTNTACSFDIRLYLTPLGQDKQFIETYGT
jgi:hypothetical protein